MIARARALAGRRPELVVLLAFALAAGMLLSVLQLGSEVMEGDTRSFDIAFLTGLRHTTQGNAPWAQTLRTAMLDITALGDNTTLVIVIAMVAGFLLLAGKGRLALLLVAATASGAGVTGVLKAHFDRPRPDVVMHLASFAGASFPSGHAMNSAVTYLTLAGLIAPILSSVRLRIYILCCAVGLTFAIGVSRLYLGVHWGTDVLAGWIAGSGWAALCWCIAWWLRTRGRGPIRD